VTRRACASGFEQTLARVVEAEHDLSLLTERVARFRRIGSWIVEERFAFALLRSRVGDRSVAAPAPLFRAGAAILRALASPARLASACQARAIFAKTNQWALVRDQLRTFYFEPRPLTLKLIPPKRRDDLARELAARSEMPAEFGAPAVLGYRLEGRTPTCARSSSPAAARIPSRMRSSWSRLWWARCGKATAPPASRGVAAANRTT